MKKYVFLLLGALGASSMMNAQRTVLEGNKFGDNWSIGLNGGIVTPLTHSAFFKNSRAVIGLDINKQLSPIYGMTLEGNWTINTQSRMAELPKSCTAFDAIDVMLLHRLNLNNIFAGYKGQPRLFEVEALGGFGWLRMNKFYNDGRAANHAASKAGLNFNFNLGEKKAWTVSVKPAIFWDLTKWDKETQYANHLKYNVNYANWEIMAGITYHFKNSNGKHYMTKTKPYNAAEVANLNATINDLRKTVNDKDASLKDAADKLNNEQQKSAELQKALDDCRNQAPQVKVVDNSKKTLESVVTYRQGKTSIDASQQPNVERIATYLKHHKDAKVEILGYASPEGNADINARIANQRAEAVKNMLVSKYKIDASRISAKGQGVGNMFEEADWNRVSICTIVEK